MRDALTLLRMNGVVGGGGAGFPTWKKLEAPVQTLLINGAECEPLLKSDQYLMLHRAGDLVDAAEALRTIVGAERVCIALKGRYAAQAAALREAIAVRGAVVEIQLLGAVYPVGDEQAIVHACTGRVVPPQSLPGSVGCTVVSVSTALNSLDALYGEAVTARLVTVAGEVAEPGLYQCPVGMSIPDVLRAAGGARVAGYRVLLGGPMMGELLSDPADAVITKTCGGILVLPAEHLLVRRAELPVEHMRNRAKAACIQCRYCTDLCPRYLAGHALEPHRVMRAFAMDEQYASALLCMECGICELYACPMGLSPCRVQVGMKAALRQAGAVPDRTLRPEQEVMRAGRQVPSHRLAERIGVATYDIPVPEESVLVEATSVAIPVKQHIGAPAEAIVHIGERVQKGQPIARMAEGALGADVHASIDGIVTEIGTRIVLRAEGCA